jgi:hypothetical protein
MLEGRKVNLETVEEIVAKKIVYRGANLRPRDIYDLWAVGAAAHVFRTSGIGGVEVEKLDAAIRSIGSLSADFVDAAAADLELVAGLRSPPEGFSVEVVDWLKHLKMLRQTAG